MTHGAAACLPQCCYTPAKGDGGFSCTTGKEMKATAGARSTSGVAEPPTAHGAALAWAGDVRADPDPLVLRGVPREDYRRTLDIRCRRAAHCTRRRPGLGRRCAGRSRSAGSSWRASWASRAA